MYLEKKKRNKLENRTSLWLKRRGICSFQEKKIALIDMEDVLIHGFLGQGFWEREV